MTSLIRSGLTGARVSPLRSRAIAAWQGRSRLLSVLLACAGGASGAAAQVPTLIDVNPYSVAAANSSPSGFARLGASVVFAANDGVNGTELWISDGTEPGTVLLKDINPGSASSSPDNLVAFGSRVIFTAIDGVNGRELWITDGTEAGTVLLKDVRPGATGATFSSATGVIGQFGQPDSYVVFGANDGVNGSDLWVSDGTAAGTNLLLNIAAGSSSSNPSGFFSHGGFAYFLANDQDAFGNELWRTDGTLAGTQRISDIAAGTASSGFSLRAIVDGWGYGAATVAGLGQEPWAINLDTLETRNLGDLRPGANGSLPQDFVVLGNDVYFRADTAGTDNKLFRVAFDRAGDPVAADLVAEINPSGNDNVGNLGVYDGSVYFAATDGVNGRELWRYDGVNPPARVIDLNAGPGDSTPAGLTVLDGRLLFTASTPGFGREWYATQGTAGTTQRLTDLRIGPGNGVALTPEAIELGGSLLFAGTDTSAGTELFATNGTVSGTVLVKDIRPQTGNASSQPTSLRAVNGLVYFSATDEARGRELWVSDGTADGTRNVIDANPGTANGAPEALTVFGNDLLFVANAGTSAALGQTGIEYYRATGDTAAIIADINPGTGSSAPGSGATIAVLNNAAYFNATDGVTGAELWRYDGTTVSQVADQIPGSGSLSPTFITATGGALYFRGVLSGSGTEPYTSDGSTIASLGDYLPGSGSSLAQGFFAFDGRIFFQASQSSSFGVELAVYDPATMVITQVDDIRPGASASSPQNFVEFNGDLYFTATDGGGNIQLFTATHVPGSTQVRSNAIGSTATTLVRSGDFLYFAAGNLVGTNVELWAFDGVQNGGQAFPIEINASAGSFPTGLIDVDGVLYFAAVGNSGGNELYRVTLDGSGVPVGAELVADLNPDGGSNPRNFAVTGNKLFFTADDGVNGEELWVLEIQTQAPCPGNYNGDGGVDLLDLLAFNADWSANLGQSVTPGASGDYNASGTVDLLDLLAFNADWSANLGQSCP